MDLREFTTSELESEYKKKSGEDLLNFVQTYSTQPLDYNISISQEELSQILVSLQSLQRFYSQKLIPKKNREELNELINCLQQKTAVG